MQDIDLTGIREWYKYRLGFEIPETRFLEVSQDLVPDDFESILFMAPPVRDWDDIDKKTFDKSK